MVSFVKFARIASIYVGFHLGTLHSYFFHLDFWPNLNFPLECQIKLVLTYFNKVKFTRNFRSCSKNSIEKQDGRFVAMVTKDLQTLNLKFDQVMFNSLVLTWEKILK